MNNAEKMIEFLNRCHSVFHATALLEEELKEAGFTFEEAEALVKDNPKLMDFCSKYYKSAQKPEENKRLFRKWYYY